MILIYTQELDNAIIMAASLAGIQTPAGIIKLGDLELHKLQIKQDALNFGYIKGGINNNDAAFIWGNNVIKVAKPSDYGFKSSESEGFFPPELRYLYVEENEAHAKRLVATLVQEDNSIIYDASIGLGGRFLFSSLYCFAGLGKLNKQIHRVELSSLSEDEIIRAFSSPKSCEESEREIIKNQTQQFIYYLANNNLPLLIPGQKAYPRVKDLGILNELTKRADLIEEETSKEQYTISLKALSPHGEVILKSKNATFAKKEPAKEFVSRLPDSVEIHINTSTEYTRCDGPHSAISIMKAAQTAFHYPPQKTGIILEDLQSKGLINSSSSAVRLLPESMEEDFRDILRMLSSFPNIFPENLKPFITKPFEQKIITDTRNCGIIPTRKKPTSSLSEAQRNIYSLIAKEFIKCILGRKVQEKRIAQVTTQGITFSASGHTLLSPGFSVLDGQVLSTNTIPNDIKDQDMVQIQYILEKKTGSPPKPFLEMDIRKKFTDSGCSFFYSQGEISAVIDDLQTKNLVIIKGKTIHPTENSCQIIHELNDYDGLILASTSWEDSLRKICDLDKYSLEDAILQSTNLIKSVRDQLKGWLNQKLEKTGIQTNILCPKCGKFLTSTPDALTCKYCNFKISKTQFGKNLSLDELEQLLKNGSTKMIAGFNNLEGTDGRLYLEDNGKVSFTTRSKFVCPICHANPEYRNGIYRCDCGFVAKTSYFGHHLEDQELAKLFSTGKTPVINNFIQNEKRFRGLLYIDIPSKSIKCIAIEEPM